MNFPLGHQAGKPCDSEGQTRILLDALHVLETATTPGTLVQLPYKWDERDPLDSWEQPMKTRHYHGVRKYLSERAVSRVLSGYAALTRPTVKEEQEMLHPSVV